MEEEKFHHSAELHSKALLKFLIIAGVFPPTFPRDAQEGWPFKEGT